MALLLAGEALQSIQGADAQGWVREITALDALPGLKIDQQGVGRIFDFQDGGSSKMYLPDGGDVTLVGSLVFDLANDVTITPSNPSAPRTLTLPAVGQNSTFAFLQEAQAFTALQTFNGGVDLGSSGSLLNVGAAGNDWTATTLTLASGLALTHGSGNDGMVVQTINTQDVSTSATPVASATNFGVLTIVGGEIEGGTTPRFVDLVLWGREGTPTVLGGNSVRGTPPARTYTIVSQTLNLAMASGTYDIHTYNWYTANPT